MDIEQLKQLVDRGESFSKIAKMFGKNVGQVSRLARKHGITSRHMGAIQRKQLPIAKIYKAYKNGESLHSLHKRYEAPVARIKRQLRAYDPTISFRSMDDAKRPSELNDPGKLYEYAEAGLTCREIAERLGVKQATVLAAYKRHNRKHFKSGRQLIPKKELERLYWKEKMSSLEIGNMLGMSPSEVIKQLHESNIPVRGMGGDRHSSYKELMEAEWLKSEYLEKERSMASIACQLHTTIGNVSHFLRKAGIPIRSKKEVYDKLAQVRSPNATGCHNQIMIGDQIFNCDSLLERSFLQSLPKGTQIAKPPRLKWDNLVYQPDFIVDGRYVEVKPSCFARKPGVDRQRLVKQFLVASKNRIELSVWDGQYRKIQLEDIDRYYCLDWRLLFDTAIACSDWLIQFGFMGVLYPRDVLIRALNKLAKKSLNANIPNVDVVALIRHFSPHYFRSHHADYNPITAIWDRGNHMVLRRAVEMLYRQNKNINLYGLINIVARHFKDFAMVSIFKPWVASYVYDRFLPNGGIVVDPCMGWGGRLLGCIDRNIEYRGSDLNSLSVESNRNLRRFVGRRLGKTSFDVADASSCSFPDGDLLFTSPPYDATEHYYGIDSYQTQTTPIVSNIFKKFEGKTVVMNIPKRLESLCRELARCHNWVLLDRLEMKTASFMGRNKTFEPILAFKR